MWRVGIGYRMQPSLRQSLHVAAERIDRKRVRVALVANGPAWVWNALEECFPEGRRILDYYHCAEHVWGAADALHGEGTSEAREWAEAFLTRTVPWKGRQINRGPDPYRKPNRPANRGP